MKKENNQQTQHQKYRKHKAGSHRKNFKQQSSAVQTQQAPCGQVVQKVKRINRSFTYNSKARTLCIEGITHHNVGENFLDIVFGKA